MPEDFAIHMKLAHFQHVFEDNLTRRMEELSFGRYQCELCARELRSRMGLKNHMRDAHRVKVGSDGVVVPYTTVER